MPSILKKANFTVPSSKILPGKSQKLDPYENPYLTPVLDEFTKFAFVINLSFHQDPEKKPKSKQTLSITQTHQGLPCHHLFHSPEKQDKPWCEHLYPKPVVSCTLIGLISIANWARNASIHLEKTSCFLFGDGGVVLVSLIVHIKEKTASLTLPCFVR